MEAELGVSAGETQSMHKEGHAGTRHIPATSPVPGSAVLLFRPMLDFDTSCLPQINAFGVKPVTPADPRGWDVPIHPGAPWDSPLVVPRAALGQRQLPAPQWGTSCGGLWSGNRPPHPGTCLGFFSLPGPE